MLQDENMKTVLQVTETEQVLFVVCCNLIVLMTDLIKGVTVADQLHTIQIPACVDFAWVSWRCSVSLPHSGRTRSQYDCERAFVYLWWPCDWLTGGLFRVLGDQEKWVGRNYQGLWDFFSSLSSAEMWLCQCFWDCTLHESPRVRAAKTGFHHLPWRDATNNFKCRENWRQKQRHTWKMEHRVENSHFIELLQV